MMYQTKFMADRARCSFSQRNNAIEKLIDELETCGTTANVSCLNSVGYKTNLWRGVQEEDYCACYLNNERNYEKFLKIRPGLDPKSIPGNRVPQYYPIMNEELFGAVSAFFMGNLRSNLIGALREECAVLVCYHSPGHYVAAVGYDSDGKEIIYNDPMGGFNLRLSTDRLDQLHDWGVIIWPPS
jgi:hypothetical protein